MPVTIRGALLGLVVIAASFWATLLVLDYGAGPRVPPGTGTSPSAPAAAPAPSWNEALYLAVHPDVAAAVARKDFKSGREHYELAGRAERRQGGFVSGDWDEAEYLSLNPGVARAVSEGRFLSAYHHYLAAGRDEGRRGGFPPGRAPDK
jgi:hypothetical protein